MTAVQMEAGRALDRLVGARVMGDVVTHPSHDYQGTVRGRRACWRCHYVASGDARDEGPCEVDPPYYSTAIGAAWLVAEKLHIAVMPFMLCHEAAEGEEKKEPSTDLERAASARWVWGAQVHAEDCWCDPNIDSLTDENESGRHTDHGGHWVFAETAPLAICRCALREVADAPE